VADSSDKAGDKNSTGRQSGASGGRPGSDQPSSDQHGAMRSLVRVESLIQLALMLPAATVIGWLIGVGLDRWLHQNWIYIVGLILGAVAGFVQIFRVVLAETKE
jgi:ATP synthase protein I